MTVVTETLVLDAIGVELLRGGKLGLTFILHFFYFAFIDVLIALNVPFVFSITLQLLTQNSINSNNMCCMMMGNILFVYFLTTIISKCEL